MTEAMGTIYHAVAELLAACIRCGGLGLHMGSRVRFKPGPILGPWFVLGHLDGA